MCLSRACPTETEPLLINHPATANIVWLMLFQLLSVCSKTPLVFSTWTHFIPRTVHLENTFWCPSTTVLSAELWFNWLLPLFSMMALWLSYEDCVRDMHVMLIKTLTCMLSLHHRMKSGPVWEYRSLIAFAWWCSRIVLPRCHLCQTQVHVTVNRPEKSP